MTETNWAGNHSFAADRLHRPRSVDELATIVASAQRVGTLGSRHSFTDIADAPAGDLVALDQMPRRFEVAPDRSTVTVSAHLTYAELAQRLEPQGLAVHNLASLPHITIAGAVATGTHGSGDRNGNLATSVVGLDILRSDGDIVTIRQADPDFDGSVVSVGALGTVISVTLATVPAFEVHQHVIEDVPWQALDESFDAVFASGYSVSAFCRFGRSIDQLWIKRLDSEPAPRETFGGRPATENRHPIIELPADNCTPQLGLVGPWSERLPHFRPEFSPNVGDELQSEYFVARGDGPSAVRAVRGIAHRLAPALLVSEIRTVAGDDLWLSPHQGRDSVGLHFTWRPDPGPVGVAVQAIETALAPFRARPHWGKVFTPGAFSMTGLYPHHDDFIGLAARLDPRGAFRNPWFDRVFG